MIASTVELISYLCETAQVQDEPGSIIFTKESRGYDLEYEWDCNLKNHDLKIFKHAECICHVQASDFNLVKDVLKRFIDD